MRKLIIIFAFLFANMQVQANIYGKAALCGWFAAGAMTPAFDHYWYDADRPTNGLYLSTGFDPKMALDEGLDIRFKAFGHYNKIEPSITYEYFKWADLEAVSLGLDYMIIRRKLSWLAGVEGSKIWNSGDEVLSWGVNSEVRFLLSSRWAVSYVGNIKTRPENSHKKAVYSGYLNLIFKIL